jgi:alkaline phosphatase D
MRLTRRSFLRSLGSLATIPLLRDWPRARSGEVGTPAVASAPIAAPAGVTRTWLGPELWANRLADFRVAAGRYECRTTGKLRSVGVLTHDVAPGPGTASWSMVTGTIAAGSGFSGFLIGVGGGRLDYRAAALAQAASGTDGGLLCTFEADGVCRIRSHTSEVDQFSYPVIAEASTPGTPRSLTEQVRLVVDIAASPVRPKTRFRVTVTARRAEDNALLSQVSLDGLRDARVAGGVSVVSAGLGSSAARYWFTEIRAAGSKTAHHPKRVFGPVLGVLFSLNGRVLKLAVHLAPIGQSEPQRVVLRWRSPGTRKWIGGPSARVGDGWVALLRHDAWDVTQAWEYQVVYGAGTPSEAPYGGTIPRSPRTADVVRVGVVNCQVHSYRSLDQASDYTPLLPAETPQGLYTPNNLYFPYAEIADHLSKRRPHLLAALGDQYYEHRPTAQDQSTSPTLDSLYRFSLWLWAYRGLTRNIPCIVLLDDHDVYQGNLWGHEGAPAPAGDRSGGYVKDAAWVNTIQRVQALHNPDPYDPTPVQQGISVNYGAFTFGGVSFAFLEDRKFKYGPTPVDPLGNPTTIDQLPMLGDRQEQFLADWATISAGRPKVVLSQTTYATVKTSPTGGRQSDPDNNAYVQARDRALSLVKRAGALMIAGDQHLGTVVRHGLNTFTDGPVQFTVPAAGTAWQRWFEPGALPNSTGTPNTGDWTDGYGNKFRVLACVNPKITQQEYLDAYGASSHNFGDRALKNEGFGVLRIDRARRQFVMECWRWDVDPTDPAAQQFPGWPVTVGFDHT